MIEFQLPNILVNSYINYYIKSMYLSLIAEESSRQILNL